MGDINEKLTISFSGLLDTRDAVDTEFNPATFEEKVVKKYPNVDLLYGPYNSPEEAFTALAKANSNGVNALVQYKTVGIIDKGEYWLKEKKDSYTVEDLVKKGGDILSGAYIFCGNKSSYAAIVDYGNAHPELISNGDTFNAEDTGMDYAAVVSYKDEVKYYYGSTSSTKSNLSIISNVGSISFASTDFKDKDIKSLAIGNNTYMVKLLFASANNCFYMLKVNNDGTTGLPLIYSATSGFIFGENESSMVLVESIADRIKVIEWNALGKDEALTSAVTLDTPVGNIPAGSVISKGTTFSEFVKNVGSYQVPVLSNLAIKNAENIAYNTSIRATVTPISIKKITASLANYAYVNNVGLTCVLQYYNTATATAKSSLNKTISKANLSNLLDFTLDNAISAYLNNDSKTVVATISGLNTLSSPVSKEITISAYLPWYAWMSDAIPTTVDTSKVFKYSTTSLNDGTKDTTSIGIYIPTLTYSGEKYLCIAIPKNVATIKRIGSTADPDSTLIAGVIVSGDKTITTGEGVSATYIIYYKKLSLGGLQHKIIIE